MEIQYPTMSRHAEIRANQRGLNRLVVDLLWDFGRESPAGGGSVRLQLDKVSRRQVRSMIHPTVWRMVEPKLNSYLIVSSDGCITTAARRLCRRRS